MIFQEHEDATYGAGIELIQKTTGAPYSTAARWKKKPDAMPEAARRLCRFAVFGDVSEVFGKEWEGFTLAGGKLYPPLFRRGFTPEEIGGLFFTQQNLFQTQSDLKNATRLLEAERKRSAQLKALLVGVPQPEKTPWC